MNYKECSAISDTALDFIRNHVSDNYEYVKLVLDDCGYKCSFWEKLSLANRKENSDYAIKIELP